MAEDNQDFDPAAIKTQLENDTDGKLRDIAVKTIEEKAMAIKKRMDAGVAPAEFRVLEGLHKALEAANHVVVVAWDRMRKQQEAAAQQGDSR